MFTKCDVRCFFLNFWRKREPAENTSWLERYLHSSWGCCFSYFSLIWETPKSGCNQWSASEWRWVRRRPREDTQRNLWISAIFWITPCYNTRKRIVNTSILTMTMLHVKCFCVLPWHLCHPHAWYYWPSCRVHYLSQSNGRFSEPDPWSPGVVQGLRQSPRYQHQCCWASQNGISPHNHWLLSDCGWVPSRKTTPCLTRVIFLGLTGHHILREERSKCIRVCSSVFKVHNLYSQHIFPLRSIISTRFDSTWIRLLWFSITTWYLCNAGGFFITRRSETLTMTLACPLLLLKPINICFVRCSHD